MPDAILLDWNMPRMEGIDFMRELRQRPGGTEPKIIFCTANNELEDVQLAIGGKADIAFHGRPGGIIPTPAEFAGFVYRTYQKS